MGFAMTCSISRRRFCRRAIALAAAACCALVFVRCSTDTRTDVVLSYGMFGTPEQIQVEKQLLTEFERANPGIRVKLRTPSSGGYMEKLMTELAGRVAPDVMFMGADHFSSFAGRQVFQPLDKMIGADPEFRMEDYFPEIMKAFTWKGSLYAIPKNAASNVVFYNKNHFEAAGIPYPDGTWTWDELLNIAKRLTGDLDNDGRIDQFGLAGIDGLDFLRQHGVEILSADCRTCTLNTTTAAECVQFMKDAVYVHRAIPTQSQTAGFGLSGGATGTMGIFELFAAGRVSMFIFDIVLSLKYQDAKFDWDVTTQPRGPLGLTYIHGGAYPMNVRTRHPDESWKLMKFLSGPYVQEFRAGGGESLPSLKELAVSDAWMTNSKRPANRKAVLDQMKTARPAPAHPRWPSIVAEVHRMFGETLAEANPADIKTALAETERRIERILHDEE
jgi:multiple sugar transport system substrate-binding protein